MLNKNLSFVLIAASCTLSAVAFVPTTPTRQTTHNTALALGIPKFILPKEEDDEQQRAESSSPANRKKQETKIDAKGLIQLIAFGIGSPMLGDFEGVDKESGKFMFSLEANNLVDENGNSKQTAMPYFESGWVDENDTGFKWPWEKKDAK